jgi:pantoate--beta-alanine ligase
MDICLTIAEARAARVKATEVALVPTMGALHAGHVSLVRMAKSQSEVVAASIFVNPKQFGPNEDYSRYPRSFERDCDMLEKEGVSFVFAPGVEEMYPPGGDTWVTVEGLSEKLDGGSRPGHFRGVTTVVSKLFHIVEPQKAFFGQKDAAQLAIIRRMVRDLNMPIEIVGCPIVREPDGLALSSRNAYLDSQQRQSALVLHRTLLRIEEMFNGGESNVDILIAAGMKVIAEEPGARLDYMEVVDPDSLNSMSRIDRPALAAIAAYVGTTRLIDNVLLNP